MITQELNPKEHTIRLNKKEQEPEKILPRFVVTVLDNTRSNLRKLDMMSTVKAEEPDNPRQAIDDVKF